MKNRIIVVRTTKKDEVVDITKKVHKEIDKSVYKNGLCHIFVLHTTCCITTADLDPGTDLDLLDVLRKLLPEIKFRHPHDPSHAPDHILSSIIGQSLFVPVQNGKLALGTWQRVVLIELNGPRDRNIVISTL